MFYKKVSVILGISLFGLVSVSQSTSFSEITASFDNQLKLKPTSILNSDETRFQVLLPTSNQTITLVARYKQKFNQYELWGGIVKEIKNSGFSIELRDGIYTGELQITDSQQQFTISSGTNQQLILKEDDPSKGFCIQENQNETKSKINEESNSPYPALAPIPVGIDIEKLQSMSDGTGVILLDRDGHTVTSSYWTNRYNSGNSFFATAAGIGDDEYYAIWQTLNEDFSPFKLNITTDESVYNTYPINRRSRLIITQNKEWQNISTTGIANIGGFDNGVPNFCFPSGFSSNSTRPYKLAEVCSHEVGHAMGISHAGSNSTSYYRGHGTSLTHSKLWGPIMGSTYSTQISHWSKGEYSNANNSQDNLALIASAINGLGYKDDDHGNTTATASELTLFSNGTINTNSGIIEKNTDVDLFSFSAGNGSINITVNPYDYKPNLDAKIELIDAAGSVVSSSDPATVEAPFLNTTVTAGTYYLRIDGVGYLNPLNTGYSDYGSLGQYTISGSIPLTDGVSSDQFSSSTNNSSNLSNSSVAASSIALSSNVTMSSSLSLSSSQNLSSSSDQIDCSGIPIYSEAVAAGGVYQWGINRDEQVVYNYNLWIALTWVDISNKTPEEASVNEFKNNGNCRILQSNSSVYISSTKEPSSQLFSSQAPSSKILLSNSSTTVSSEVITFINQFKNIKITKITAQAIFYNQVVDMEFKLFNSKGKQIESGHFMQNQIIWKTPLSNGVYFLNIDNQVVRFSIY